MIQIRPVLHDKLSGRVIKRSKYEISPGEPRKCFPSQLFCHLPHKKYGTDEFLRRFELNFFEYVQLAVSITMIGVPLPADQACERCKNLKGPFQFCTVLQGHSKGACNNCIYDEEGNYCTFREGTIFPPPEASAIDLKSR